MNVLEQFRELLAENEELAESFAKVEGVFNDAIKTRDKAKEENRTLKAFKTDLEKKFELEDASVEDIVAKTTEAQNTDVEKIEQKYQADLEALRAELTTRDDSINELNGKYNDTVFENSIVQSGLLSDFVEEPMARKNITEQIKKHLIYEDGKVYVKDETTGDKATDLHTGEFLSPKSVIENIKKTISPIYLNPQTTNSGMGTPPRNQGQPNNGLKRSAMSHGEKGSFIAEHGQDAYLALPN
jgi:hypothetical protein